MKQHTMMFWLVAFFSFGGQAAYACSCQDFKAVVVNANAPKPNPEIDKWRREQPGFAFFVGQVVKIEKVKVRWSRSPDVRDPMKRVTVRVEKYWTGVKNPKIVIFTGMGNGDCGVPYLKGKQYFFATSRVYGLLKTMDCWSSKVDGGDARDINTVFGDAIVFQNRRRSIYESNCHVYGSRGDDYE